MNPTPDQRSAVTELVQEMARRYLLLETGLASGVDDITKAELQVIELVGLYEISTVTEVATVGQVPLSTASWIVNKLVEKGYLSRSPDLDDRRVTRLDLNEEGQQVMNVVHSAF
ncbi:MAG: MarR family transcriptional regulator, partial [Anaerolineales bacterium]|nr:MarR family transcriptional regulator [Anaerolineales bacterium]